MNGTKYILDTTAVIALLDGNQFIEQQLTKADWIGISVISILEFLAYPFLSSNDKALLKKLIERVEVVPILNEFDSLAFLATFKKESNLKLPDALIAGIAVQHQAILITNDKHFSKIPSLQIINY